MCVNQKVMYYNMYLKSDKFSGTLILDRTTDNVSYVKHLVECFGGVGSFIQCGQCIECKSKKALEWSLRLLAEYETNKGHCYFITLTYDDEHLQSKHLISKDLHRFIDNLHKHNYKFKYYACGEYGAKSLRPHFHLILWLNKPIDDLIKYDDRLYTSDIINNIWVNRGQVKIGLVDIGAIMYVAGYVDKKLTKTENLALVPEFQRFSKGLGLDYFNLHCKEMLKDDKIYFNGKAYGLPRYYSKLLKSLYPADFEKLRKERYNANFEEFNFSCKSEHKLYKSQKQREKFLIEYSKLKKQRDIT